MRPTGRSPEDVHADQAETQRLLAAKRRLADVRDEQRRLAAELSFYRTDQKRKPALRASWAALDAERTRLLVELGRST